jgi:hypothetical protein
VVKVWQYGSLPFTVTLAYSPTLDLYIGRADLAPDRRMAGRLQIWARSSEGAVGRLFSGFRVWPVQADETFEAVSWDGSARMLFLDDNLEQDSAVSIVPGGFLGRPPGYVPLSRPYHIGISPATPELSGQGSLSIYYDPGRLTQVVSGTVGLYLWDSPTQTWLPAGGTLYPEREFVTERITRLGSYAILGQARLADWRVYLPVLLRQG